MIKVSGCWDERNVYANLQYTMIDAHTSCPSHLKHRRASKSVHYAKPASYDYSLFVLGNLLYLIKSMVFHIRAPEEELETSEKIWHMRAFACTTMITMMEP